VRLGAAEAKQTAALFGGSVDLYEATASGAAGVTAAADQLLSERKVAVLIASAAGDVAAFSQFAERHGIVFINVASRSATLRSACRRYTFHVETTASAYQNASALARTGTHAMTPPRAISVAANADSAQLWSSMLERFGASQLNARYRTMFDRGMDGAAWAGWFAVKTASEAALRARSAEPKKIVRYLESAATQFDGHKGWPLTFRASDHQLRQPLYIVVADTNSRSAGGSPVRDVPDIRLLATGSENPAALLDRVLGRPGRGGCSWLQL
jgi:ABC-type branched-subunit amino acid transport system substrate-binding protein